jgi:hypothetical protein
MSVQENRLEKCIYAVPDTQRNRGNHINYQPAHTERTNIKQSTTTSTTKEQQFPLYNKYILKHLMMVK